MSRFKGSNWSTILCIAPLAMGALACRTEPLPTGVRVQAGGVALAAAASVPFRVTYVITPQLLVPGDDGYPARCPTGQTNAAAPATGEGYGVSLGHVTESESSCVDFATLALTLGEFTFTAANGDQVWGEFEGSASFDPPPPNANLDCTWKITGGTGRFVDATGAGNCVNSRQLGNGTSLIEFVGSIAYNASNRADR